MSSRSARPSRARRTRRRGTPRNGPGQLPRARTGVLVGMTGAAISFLPTLIPRATRDQVLITAGSTLASHGAGALAQSVFNALPLGEDTVAKRLASTVAVGTTAVVVNRSLARGEEDSLTRASVRATSGVLAYSSLAGGASLVIDAATLAAGQRSRRQGLTIPVLAWGAGAAATLWLARRGLKAQAAARSAYDPPPPSLRRTLALSGAAVVVAETAMLTGEYAVARTGRVLAGALPGTDRQWTAAISLALGVGAGAAAWTQWDKVVAKFRLSNAAIEAGYAEPPESGHASGGPGSVVPYASLGVQGRRFVNDRVRPDQIESVTGEPARAEPIRLYVGMDSDPDQSRRIGMALEELERSGAYDRSLIILASPSGSGYVNSIPVETAEYLTRGDVATVAMQYDRKPSVLSLDKSSEAAYQNRLVLSGIVKSLRSRPSGRQPRIVLYGESLGAQTSQDMFLHQGTLGVEVLGVDRALWVGTPFASGWRKQVLADRRADVDPTLVRQLRWGSDASTATDGEREHILAWLLEHPEDPVVHFGIDLLVQRPAWLTRNAPDRPVPRESFWWPIVTFIGTLVDTVNAARVVPGQFRAFGHDYRADLARTVRIAWALGDARPAQMAAIEQALRDAEMARSARIEQGLLTEAASPAERVQAKAAELAQRSSGPTGEPVMEPAPVH